MINAFIPKDDQELPDSYGATIHYLDGKREDFRLAWHTLDRSTMTFEFITDDDLCSWVPLASIKRIAWDRDFSTVVRVGARLRAAAEKAAGLSGPA